MLAVTLVSIFFNHNNFFLTYHATFFIFQLLFKHKSWNPNQEPVNQVFLGVNQFRHYLRSIQTEQVNCRWWLILIQMLHQLPQLSWSKNQNNFGKNLQNTYKYSSAKIITPPRRFSSFQRGTVSLCKSKGCKVTVRQTLRMIKIIRDSNPGRTRLVRLRPCGRTFCQISNFDSW